MTERAFTFAQAVSGQKIHLVATYPGQEWADEDETMEYLTSRAICGDQCKAHLGWKQDIGEDKGLCKGCVDRITAMVERPLYGFVRIWDEEPDND